MRGRVSANAKRGFKSFRHIGLVYMLLACICYSAHTILAKVISVGPVQIGLCRVGLMNMFLIPNFLRFGMTGLNEMLGPSDIRLILVLRGVIGSVAGLLFYYAIKYTSPGLTICISFLDVVLNPIFARIFLKEALTLLDMLFAFIAFSGVILIARPPFLFPSSDSDPENFIGILYAVSGAILASCSSLTLRKIGKTVSALVPTFYFAFSGFLIYATLLLITGDFEFPCLQQVGLIALLAAAGFSGVLLFTTALHTERPSTTSVVNTLQIVLVLLVQIFFLHDIPSTLSIVGSCLIFSTSICLGIRKIVNEKRK